MSRRVMALALAALAVAVVGLLHLRSDSDDAGTSTPAGYRATAYRGLELSVPGDWSTDEGDCGTPSADTVITSHPMACTAVIRARRTGISSLTWGGGRADCTPQGSGDVISCTARSPRSLENLEVGIVERRSTHAVGVVESPDPELVARIVATARAVESVDGCDVRLTSLDPEAPSRTGSLVPGTPDSVTVCRYRDLLLESTGTRPGAAFARALNALPPGLRRYPVQPPPDECARESGSGYRIRFGYAEGPDLWVTLRLIGCGAVLGYDNGAVTGYPTQEAVALPIDLTGVEVLSDLAKNVR